ncbi:MAG: PLP-dependent transferase, partial [Rubrivivax sp.]
ANARKVVDFLASHTLVEHVAYPELESHPDHTLARRLLPRGCGSVFSFDLRGSRQQGKAFIEALKIFSHLANVGDCRSLVIHPASTTHFRLDDDALRQAGIGPGTIRLSIGLEDADDLIDDLGRALTVAEKAADQAGGGSP